MLPGHYPRFGWDGSVGTGTDPALGWDRPGSVGPTPLLVGTDRLAITLGWDRPVGTDSVGTDTRDVARLGEAWVAVPLSWAADHDHDHDARRVLRAFMPRSCVAYDT